MNAISVRLLPEDVPVGLRGLGPLLLDDVDAGETVQRSDVLPAAIMIRVNIGITKYKMFYDSVELNWS